MIKGIVFDMDHTLFDRYGTVTAISSKFCEHFKGRLAKDITPEIFTQKLTAADKKYVYSGWEQVFAELIRTGVFGATLSSSCAVI